MGAAGTYFCAASGAFARKVLRFLEVILHIGAHRTGTTSLQAVIQKNQYNLRQNGLTYWGPQTTRGGLFSGLLRRAELFDQKDTVAQVARNTSLIRMELDRLADRNQHSLLISEENFMGSMRHNLRTGRLYPGLARRLRRCAGVIGPMCRRVALCVRPYDTYWASAISYAIPTGHRVLAVDEIEQLAGQSRGWRDVISDVCQAFPDAEVCIWEFDRLVGNSATQFQILTRGLQNLRFRSFAEHHNASVSCAYLRQVLLDRGNVQAADKVGARAAKYTPFSALQTAKMKARYAADIDWLRTIGDGRIVFADGLDRAPQKSVTIAKRGAA